MLSFVYRLYVSFFIFYLINNFISFPSEIKYWKEILQTSRITKSVNILFLTMSYLYVYLIFNFVCTDYDSKLAIEAAMFEYQSTLGRFYNEPLMMKSSAHEIIHSFCRLSDESKFLIFIFCSL